MRLPRFLTILAVVFSTMAPALEEVPVTAAQHLQDRARVARCMGERATIVGNPAGGSLAGTSGRDVIVSNGAVSVNALSGNDLVCLTGAPRTARQRVNAGNGNDVVINTTALPADVSLVQGRDTFTGGPGAEYVTTARDYTSRGPDRISAGAGRDILVVDTTVEKGLLLRGGPDVDVISPRLRRPLRVKRLTIDNRQGKATLGQVGFTLSGFEYFNLIEPRLTFMGRDMAEVVNTGTPYLGKPYQVAVNLGGGDDELRVEDTFRATTKLRGGEGDDILSMFAFDTAGPGIPALGVDLAAGSLTRSGSGNYAPVALGGFNDLNLTAGTMTIVGTGDDNSFDLVGCEGSVEGGAGQDDITWRTVDFEFDSPCTASDQAMLSGGDCDDNLIGGNRDDVLVGGEGTDTADGNAGQDSCDAESTLRCETGPPPPR